jgi:hypothetical protein
MDWTWDNVTDIFKTDGEVSYWKVAAGVAAVIAPIPAAAVTAGVVGINSYMSERDKKSEQRGEQRGESKAKAEYELKFQKLQTLLRAELEKKHEEGRYFDLVVALHAIGMACAACDGEVSLEERHNIEEFIGGVSVTALPTNVREKLAFLTENPPNLPTAFELAKKYGTDAMDLFDEVIQLVIHSDGRVAVEEMHFQQEWSRLKEAA